MQTVKLFAGIIRFVIFLSPFPPGVQPIMQIPDRRTRMGNHGIKHDKEAPSSTKLKRTDSMGVPSTRVFPAHMECRHSPKNKKRSFKRKLPHPRHGLARWPGCRQFLQESFDLFNGVGQIVPLGGSQQEC